MLPRFPLLTHQFKSEYARGLIAAAAGFYTRSALYAFTLGRFCLVIAMSSRLLAGSMGDRYFFPVPQALLSLFSGPSIAEPDARCLNWAPGCFKWEQGWNLSVARVVEAWLGTRKMKKTGPTK